MNCRMIARISRMAIFAAALMCAGNAYAGTFTVIHPFTGGVDGGPSYSNLISDAAGNLYGTTVWGGSRNCQDGRGGGVELSPPPGGGETETTNQTFLARP